jgi:hypothetical protein
MKLLVVVIVLSIGAIFLGYTDTGDYRMDFLALLGWVSLFIATVITGLIQLSQRRQRRD